MFRQYLSTRRCTAAALLLIATEGVWAQREDRDKPPLISVTGVGEVRVKPDRARLLFGVTGQATTITEAQANHDKLLTAAQAKLTEKVGGVGTVKAAAFDIRSLQSDYSGRTNVPSTVGYRVSSQLEVLLDLSKFGLDKLSDLANAAVEAGATLVPAPVEPYYREGGSRQGPSFVVFELKDDTAPKLEALRLAVASAGPKAAAVAKALGAKLGKVQSVNVGSERVFSSRPGPQEPSSRASAEWADLVVQSTVTINYAVEF